MVAHDQEEKAAMDIGIPRNNQAQQIIDNHKGENQFTIVSRFFMLVLWIVHLFTYIRVYEKLAVDKFSQSLKEIVYDIGLLNASG